MPAAFRGIVRGAGCRGTLARLSADARARVRERVVDRLTRHGVTEAETNVVHATGRRV